jgi:hypothetical protein
MARPGNHWTATTVRTAAASRFVASPSSASSWRTCPKANARNVPSVEGAGIQPPSNGRVLPARRTSQSSMLSAPRTIATKIAITLRPAFAAPGRFRRKLTSRAATASIPQPRGEHREQRHPGVRNGALIVELDPQTFQSDRLVIMHLEGDLLTAGPGCCIQPLKPWTGGHSSFTLGRNRSIARWIQGTKELERARGSEHAIARPVRRQLHARSAVVLGDCGRRQVDGQRRP